MFHINREVVYQTMKERQEEVEQYRIARCIQVAKRQAAKEEWKKRLKSFWPKRLRVKRVFSSSSKR